MLGKLIRRYTRVYRKPVGQIDHPMMTWPEFVARVEEESGVDDGATVLDIDVDIPAHGSDFDLCAVVSQRRKTLAYRFFIKEAPDNKSNGGYLMVWKGRGCQRISGMDHRFGRIEIGESRVATVNEALDMKALTWGDLKRIVQGHPDYSPDRIVSLIDVDACKPEDVAVTVIQEALEQRFVIKGKPAEIKRDPTAWATRLLEEKRGQKEEQNQPNPPAWALRILEGQDHRGDKE